MSQTETLGILQEIQALVSDHLQVVSYKWLSRKFLVSSNAAKKLLHDLVEKHEDELEVIYTVAGWLKDTPATYHIRLVPSPKLAEAKHDFDGKCSVQVYSVQACIPKDPAVIWNAEFIQAEELFKQPVTVDNCLRDNRFCGVSNSLVKRNPEGVSSAVPASLAKGAGITGQGLGSSANNANSVPVQQQKKLQQSSPQLGLLSSDRTSAKSETDKPGGRELQKEAEKDKVSRPGTKNKVQSNKSVGGNGGSLANFWGRATSKSKSTNSDQEKDNAPNDGVLVSADAQICARETFEAESSDDEGADVNFKRASSGDGVKKRRVVLDDSDDEEFENAVNLGSPDPPAGKSIQDLKEKNRTFGIENNNLNFDEQKESRPVVKEEKADIAEPVVKEEKSDVAEPVVKEEKSDYAEQVVKQEKATDADVNHPFEENFSALGKGKNARTSTSKGKPVSLADAGYSSNQKKAADTTSGSPKRRKVLKTRIDERGREVTEVVWEGEDTDTKDKDAGKKGDDNVKNSNGLSVKVEDNAAKNPVNRAPTTKKSPANAMPSQATGKASGKKGANAKGPKQGNILSFFKKV